MLGRMRPDHLGVQNGQLAACPPSPNCVSTQAEREEQRVQPLKKVGATDEVIAALTKAINSMPRTKFVTEDANYFHVECTSLICRYVDDLEIWIDEENQLIHARSASRVGYSDLGVNRKRVDGLFAELVESGVAAR